MFSRGKIKDKTAVFPRKTQGKAKNTKENHAKSVQNVRKLLFSLGKTKEKQNKKKKTPPPPKKKRPPKKIHPFNSGLEVHTKSLAPHALG